MRSRMSDVRDHDQFPDGFCDGLEPVKPVDLAKIQSFSELLHAYEDASFGARRLGKAATVTEEMIRDEECGVVLTLSGAMTVAKMSLVVCEMIERGYIQVIVSTGALMTHGLVEADGLTHFKYDPKMSDKELFERGYDRVYDTLELEKNLNDVELFVRQVLIDLPEDTVISSHMLCREMGRALKAAFPNGRSILISAYEHNVPIFIPAFSDSEMGLDFQVHNLLRKKAGKPRRAFDPFLDLERYEKWARAQERMGIFTIGGGVPRNWAQQISPYLEIALQRAGVELEHYLRFRYGVRICPDSEHLGGLSGCTYSEGASWGKFIPEEDGGRYAEVLSDATIAWPLIIKAVMERLPKKPGYRPRRPEAP
jgi:deoxyhypusine synthase